MHFTALFQQNCTKLHLHCIILHCVSPLLYVLPLYCTFLHFCTALIASQWRQFHDSLTSSFIHPPSHHLRVTALLHCTLLHFTAPQADCWVGSSSCKYQSVPYVNQSLLRTERGHHFKFQGRHDAEFNPDSCHCFGKELLGSCFVGKSNPDSHSEKEQEHRKESEGQGREIFLKLCWTKRGRRRGDHDGWLPLHCWVHSSWWAWQWALYLTFTQVE